MLIFGYYYWDKYFSIIVGLDFGVYVSSVIQRLIVDYVENSPNWRDAAFFVGLTITLMSGFAFLLWWQR